MATKYNKKYLIGGSILLAVGIIGLLMPFLPFWFSSDLDYLNEVAEAQTVPSVLGPVRPGSATPAPSADPNLPRITDRLRISDAKINMPIFASKNSNVLTKGGWIFPNTSTPDQGSNTVIFGHRFRYLPPVSNTLFHLNKVEYGDTIVIVWKGKTYTYIVDEIRIIEPTDWSVTQPSTTARITIITCAPVFSTAQRLVVSGTLKPN